jgi:hypothetical protein
MFKRIGCLIIILTISLSLFGCAGNKSKELTQKEWSYFESLAKIAVASEVYSKYGSEPGITVEKIDAYDIQGQVYVRTDFTATGSYTVYDESGKPFSGTFKVKGFSEGHGDGWDSCEITPPKNGMTTLPEQSATQAVETTDNSDITASEEPEGTVIYGPLSDFINENVGTMGTIVSPPAECDINKDGHPDLCSTVITGSGIISSLIVVYDVYNDHGYILNDRMTYDYQILGNSENDIAIERQEYGGTQKTYGTLSIQDGELIFVENKAYGVTT